MYIKYQGQVVFALFEIEGSMVKVTIEPNTRCIVHWVSLQSIVDNLGGGLW